LKRLWLIFAQAVTVMLAAIFVVATLKPQWLQQARWRDAPNAVTAQTARQIALPPTPPASVVRTGFAQAARAAAPAVVSITASKAPQSARSREPLFGFPGFPFGPRQPRGNPQLGLGSGVIISADGVLLTNNHVVEGASDIEVQLSDGRQARATLVGTDPETDIAVLKIDLPDLPAISLGDAANLQVGDIVLAIGNPFNVGQTVTSGIVSALGRNQLGINTFENFIQTDAAINPGNSGGALVDADGRLVGINTAIFSRSGGSLGIGFAIPVDVARQVATAILKDGAVVRGYIGVTTRELTPELAELLKLGDTKGALVREVTNDAPAARAGIKPGDLLTRVGERPVGSPAELLASVAALKPNSQVDVVAQRAGKAMSFSLTVAQRERPKPQRASEED
jgi:serine protease DegQ